MSLKIIATLNFADCANGVMQMNYKLIQRN